MNRLFDCYGIKFSHSLGPFSQQRCWRYLAIIALSCYWSFLCFILGRDPHSRHLQCHGEGFINTKTGEGRFSSPFTLTFPQTRELQRSVRRLCCQDCPLLNSPLGVLILIFFRPAVSRQIRPLRGHNSAPSSRVFYSSLLWLLSPSFGSFNPSLICARWCWRCGIASDRKGA
jgi:hypothetical protein